MLPFLNCPRFTPVFALLGTCYSALGLGLGLGLRLGLGLGLRLGLGLGFKVRVRVRVRVKVRVRVTPCRSQTYPKLAKVHLTGCVQKTKQF